MMNKSIVIASHNQHKVAEIRQILGEYFSNIYSLKELDINIDIVEDGKSFFENALIKAKAISKLTDMIVLADDSGLEVDSLDGQPGINSARFAGELASDQDNIDLLLKKLQGKSNRKARFICCVVIFLPNGEIISSEAITSGEILHQMQGNNGFGYDSIFYSYELYKSFAQASQEEKNKVSHRNKALHKIKSKLSLIICNQSKEI